VNRFVLICGRIVKSQGQIRKSSSDCTCVICADDLNMILHHSRKTTACHVVLGRKGYRNYFTALCCILLLCVCVCCWSPLRCTWKHLKWPFSAAVSQFITRVLCSGCVAKNNVTCFWIIRSSGFPFFLFCFLY